MMRNISIRWLMLLPGSIVLLLPILGFIWLQSWVAAAEDAKLNELKTSTEVIAALLTQNQSVMSKLTGLPSQPDELTSIAIGTVIVLDGRIDDWPVHDALSFDVDQLLEINTTYSPESFSYHLSVGADDEFLYLFYEVIDDVVVYREIGNPSVHRNDHIRIGIVGPGGVFSRYVVANYQPADISAHIVSSSGRALRMADNIRGQWRATTSGYNVELRIPRTLVGEKFSTSIADIDETNDRFVRFVMGLAATRDELGLGTIVFSSDDIQWMFKASLFANVLLRDSNGHIIAKGKRRGERTGKGEEPAYKIPAFSNLFSLFTQRELLAISEISSDGEIVGHISITENNVEILNLAWRHFESLALSSGMLLLLIVLLTIIATSLLNYRLRRVQAQFDAVISSQGRISDGLPASASADAIGELTNGLSDMVNRTRQYNDYLERMASRLSHELRTPISVVRSSLENMNQSELSEDQNIYLERAFHGIGRLSSILSKMSEAKRLEESLDEEEVIVFDFAEVVTGCVHGYETAYTKSKFNLSIEAGRIMVTGIPELLAQLLDKLIGNAVEFSKPSDPIKIRVTSNGDEVILRVINKGSELPADMESELFDSMVSFRSSTDTSGNDAHHLGLGLYIAKVITDFHGGTIRAANREDDKGVIITVVIPLMRITTRLR